MATVNNTAIDSNQERFVLHCCLSPSVRFRSLWVTQLSEMYCMQVIIGPSRSFLNFVGSSNSETFRYR